MKINEFIKEVYAYMDENNLNNHRDFPTVALYQFLIASGLSELNPYRLMKNRMDGTLAITQPVMVREQSLYAIIRIDNGELAQVNPIETIEYRELLTDEQKTNIIAVNKMLMENDSIENLSLKVKKYMRINEMDDNDYRYHDDITRDLLNIIALRNNFQKAINSDDVQSMATRQELSTSLEVLTIVLTGAIDSYLGGNRYSINDLNRNIRNIVGACYLSSDVESKKVPVSLFTNGDYDGIKMSEKGLANNTQLLSEDCYGHSIRGIIVKYQDDPSKIHDALINEILLPEMKKTASYKARFIEKTPTHEHKVNNEHVNEFIEKLRVIHPNAFIENNMSTFESAIGTDADFKGIGLILQTFDQFGICIHPLQTRALFRNYTNHPQHVEKLSYMVKEEHDTLRIYGKTETMLKYMISARETEIGKNPFLLVENMNFLKSDIITQRDGIQQLFDYCKEKNMGIKVDIDYLSSMLGDVTPLFLEIAKSYENDVFFIKDNADLYKLFVAKEYSGLSYILEHQDRLIKNMQDYPSKGIKEEAVALNERKIRGQTKAYRP